MNRFDSCVMVLSNITGVGAKTLSEGVNLLKNTTVLPESIADYVDFLAELRKKVSRVKEENITSSAVKTALSKAEMALYQAAKHKVDVLSINDSRYPPLLRHLNGDAPYFLYVKGDASCLSNRCVAVVGTREITEHGRLWGKRLTARFIQGGLTIVSGLATGCDTVAHQAAVDAGHPTIALLAAGLDSIYPKENQRLAEQIEELGCLVSEYPVGKKPMAQMFVQRDRLQSGISLGVTVIETGEVGGTMHTVGFALQQGRKLGCLYTHAQPGNAEQWVEAEKFQGNRKLVAEGKAMPLYDMDSISAYIQALDKHSVGQLPKDSAISGGAVQINIFD
jgi:DNA processing protein